MTPLENIQVEQEEKDVKKGFSIITFFSVCIVIVILFSFLRYFVFKNYDMTIEVACDPAVETCFSRDCSTGECPPNELEVYKVYNVKAFEFDKCEEDTCAHFCVDERNCERVECDAEAGDECLSPNQRE